MAVGSGGTLTVRPVKVDQSDAPEATPIGPWDTIEDGHTALPQQDLELKEGDEVLAT